jgi:altronate hydrolase
MQRPGVLQTVYSDTTRHFPETNMLQEAPLALRLNANDDVVIACRDLAAGTLLMREDVRCVERIPSGHKVATRPIGVGQPVRRYNQIIGFASMPIEPGQHVHVHNLAMRDFDRDYAFCADYQPVTKISNPATFMGYVRENGGVATRNYIGVISTVNCSATVTKAVSDYFNRGGLADFPNIDGVVGIKHSSGCGMGASGEPIEVLRRTLGGFATHPNFAGVVLIGLGCEANQMSAFMLSQGFKDGPLLHTMTIQDTGGTTKTIHEAIERVKSMLPYANAAKREPVPASHLILGCECGGSDGYSGITANPALGAAVDLLVKHGGTGILAETPEVYGAEHLLTRRAVSREVGEKLIRRIHWWEDYTTKLGGEMNNNPSPGNKAGGLTTILEKSLGAVAKGGTTAMMDVYEYAEKVTAKGFVFMDTPGYDPVSVTGLVAGGANVVCFTTGRGSAFGCQPTPSIKLATNSPLYHKQTEDMDINCGDIVDGNASVEEVGERVFNYVLEVASGKRSKSEEHGYGQDEFLPWVLGPTM